MSHAIFAAALQDIFNSAVSDAATFTPAGGVAIPCRVIVSRAVLLQPVGMEAQVYEHGITVEALLAVIGVEPKRGDVFVVNPDTAGAETFNVQATDSNDGDSVVAVVT